MRNTMSTSTACKMQTLAACDHYIYYNTIDCIVPPYEEPIMRNYNIIYGDTLYNIILFSSHVAPLYSWLTAVNTEYRSIML